MKALTGGVNFCRCEKVNCFLEILLTDEYELVYSAFLVYSMSHHYAREL